jgi:hypothetical protein
MEAQNRISLHTLFYNISPFCIWIWGQITVLTYIAYVSFSCKNLWDRSTNQLCSIYNTWQKEIVIMKNCVWSSNCHLLEHAKHLLNILKLFTQRRLKVRGVIYVLYMMDSGKWWWGGLMYSACGTEAKY